MSKTREVTTDDIKLDEVPQKPGAAKDVGVTGEIEVPVANDFKRAIDDAAFAEDVLTVHLSEPRDESDFEYCVLGVNGVLRTFRRGDTHKIPRKYVEVLARSKIMRVATKRKTLDDGSETMVPVVSYSPVYPFSVTHDPAGGKGVEWLKTIIQQPA